MSISNALIREIDNRRWTTEEDQIFPDNYPRLGNNWEAEAKEVRTKWLEKLVKAKEEDAKAKTKTKKKQAIAKAKVKTKQAIAKAQTKEWEKVQFWYTK